MLLTVPAGIATAAPGPNTTDFTTDFTIVTEQPAPDPGEEPSFDLDDRRSHKGLPEESAQDVRERIDASRTLQTLKEEGKSPSALAKPSGTGGQTEGPALRRTDPNINVCMENSKTYRTYGWTIDHFFHCQGTTQTLYKQRCRIYYGTLLDKIEVRGDVSGLKLRHSIACANLSGSYHWFNSPTVSSTPTRSTSISAADRWR
ncbi:hypothetical protein OG453_32365 [Streptomyces sp. NBC_01381]|uniref:hypothetical protein n=1 Tax=Streptomyces sp. NBC_01381 TaxID=2903845 RepID=UPI0022518458|nr:hypothetical protein [Streptomyces sp. NBC_01381]MCX4671324.1 hypothetical protein [Streptomyces sp. NBC_01381]